MRIPPIFPIAAGCVALLLPLTGQAQTFVDESSRLDAQNNMATQSWGVSMVDIDGNGLVDIYEPGRMYLQRSDGMFQSALPRLMDSEFAATSNEYGALFADLDDDGFNEMFVMDLTGDASRLFDNLSGVALVRAEGDRGIAADGQVQGSIFADFNGDGFLDLFVGEDVGANEIYLNDGTGHFTNATAGAGLESIVHTYGASAADYDQDGDLDIFIAGCTQLEPEKSLNLLFRNRGDATFEEVGAQAGINDNLSAWGVAWLDYDRDGWMDIFVANMHAADDRSGENKLYHNQGDGTFEDVSLASGVTGVETDLNFGVAAADFDNDGWVDIFAAEQTGVPYLFHNNGDGTFIDIADTAGALESGSDGAVSVGAADLNADGWVDLFTGRDYPQLAVPNHLYFNAGGANTYVTVDLIQPAPNRRAIGGHLALWNDGVVQLRDILAGDGFTSQNHALGAHFGTGTAAIVDSLVITWPDGTREKRTTIPTNTHLWLEKGGTINRPPDPFHVYDIVATKQGEWSFYWETSADPDGEPLTYRLTIRSEDGSFYFQSDPLDETTQFLTVDIPDTFVYWAVEASDGVHVRRSSNLGFTFPSSALEDPEIPRTAGIRSIYPNPARSITRLNLYIPPGEFVHMEIVDILGRIVQTDGWQGTGGQELDIATSDLAAGMYIIRLDAGGHHTTKPFLVSH